MIGWDDGKGRKERVANKRKYKKNDLLPNFYPTLWTGVSAVVVVVLRERLSPSRSPKPSHAFVPKTRSRRGCGECAADEVSISGPAWRISGSPDMSWPLLPCPPQVLREPERRKGEVVIVGSVASFRGSSSVCALAFMVAQKLVVKHFSRHHETQNWRRAQKTMNGPAISPSAQSRNGSAANSSLHACSRRRLDTTISRHSAKHAQMTIPHVEVASCAKPKPAVYGFALASS